MVAGGLAGWGWWAFADAQQGLGWLKAFIPLAAMAGAAAAWWLAARFRVIREIIVGLLTNSR